MINYNLQELHQLQRTQLQNLIDYAGSQAHLARMLNVNPSIVKSWVRRGRISKKGATDVANHPTLKEKFTLQQLRPEL